MSDPISPEHYTALDPEPLDVIVAWGLDFLRGNVLKYVARATRKGDELNDLRKARSYLDRAIKELEKGR